MTDWNDTLEGDYLWTNMTAGEVFPTTTTFEKRSRDAATSIVGVAITISPSQFGNLMKSDSFPPDTAVNSPRSGWHNNKGIRSDTRYTSRCRYSPYIRIRCVALWPF